MKTLNVVGCGRVGQTLASLWQKNGTFAIQDVTSRSMDKACEAVQFIGEGRAVESLGDMSPADCWMLTVPDSEISATAQMLARRFEHESTDRPVSAFHCSGFLPADVMKPLRRIGWQLGSTHPNLNFASPESGIKQFDGVLCGVEGDSNAVAALTQALEQIGGQCFRIASESKALYHAAAVFSSNFAVVLQGIGHDAWRTAGVPEDVIPRLNATLLRATVENSLALGPCGALTGPAARGDDAVVERQGTVVENWDPLIGRAYRTMSELATRLARTGSTTVGQP